MKRTTVAEAQSELRALIARVRAGEEVEITDDGEPVARLMPPDEAAASTRSSGSMREARLDTGRYLEQRIAEMERNGLITRPHGAPVDIIELVQPVPLAGVLDALLDERRTGR